MNDGYIGQLLRRVFSRANQIAGEVMPKGSHPRDFALLGVIAGREAYSQQELAEQLGINRTMMVKHIDKLEKRGYVVRTRNPNDRRSYVLSVTDAGREAMVKLAPSVAEGEKVLTAPLTIAERARLGELLLRMMPELNEGLPDEGLKRTPFLLIQAHYRLRRRGDEALTELGLTTRHFGALAALEQIGPCTQQRLADELGVTEPIAVQLVDFLQDNDLAIRGQDRQDRRRYALKLTPHGTAQLRKARKTLTAIEADVSESLGADGEAELRRLLQSVLTAGERLREPPEVRSA